MIRRHDVRRFRTWNVRNDVYGDAMTDIDNPWEPLLAGTETEHLVGALDRLRTTFRWKADDLTRPGCRLASAPPR